ncbi:proline-specific peptidase [Apiospora hydei]|uniref:Proline-specific peptidase n=1 Tax=Apiospora hydei TaxID=1337664 RepID=A0ABR1V6X9_9PEZI
MAEPCFTYYKIVGDLSCGKPPVVVVHGGPGAGHEYLLAFAALWPQYGLPVVLYDQIGCAASTHLRQTAGDEAFWQERLFQDELDNLLDHLELRDNGDDDDGTGPGFHLLGQSWGGMLGAAFASRRPRGLRRLVIVNGLAGSELAARGTGLLVEQMPPVMRQALEDALREEDYDSLGYKIGLEYFIRNHVCRADPMPVELLPAFKHQADDNTVYNTMMGHTFLVRRGSLKDWTVVSRLPNITAPTLVYNGEHDTSHDVAQVPFFELIPRVRWITIPGGGGPRERVLKVVGEFLADERAEDIATD